MLELELTVVLKVLEDIALMVVCVVKATGWVIDAGVEGDVGDAELVATLEEAGNAVTSATAEALISSDALPPVVTISVVRGAAWVGLLVIKSFGKVEEVTSFALPVIFEVVSGVCVGFNPAFPALKT